MPPCVLLSVTQKALSSWSGERGIPPHNDPYCFRDQEVGLNAATCAHLRGTDQVNAALAGANGASNSRFLQSALCNYNADKVKKLFLRNLK